jgi:DNA-binding NarL/FixJ family response regulator
MELRDSHEAQDPSRIMIADDHPLFRSAIRHTLEVHPDLEVVAEAANGQEAVELCRRLRPELVLMDPRMPLMEGVAATHAIKRELPEQERKDRTNEYGNSSHQGVADVICCCDCGSCTYGSGERKLGLDGGSKLRTRP